METLKELLESEDLINRAGLARKMWPDIAAPNVKMSMKMSEKVVGNGPQRFTDKDTINAADHLDSLGDRLKDWAKKARQLKK